METRPGGVREKGGTPVWRNGRTKKDCPDRRRGIGSLGAARAVSDRAIVRASPPPDFGGRFRRAARHMGHARAGPPPNGRARRRCWRARCVPLCCVLCHAGASYLFAVTPPWRASALPVARPRVASANAAIPRLRADLDAIATGGRARTATEARRAMRVPLGVQEKYLCKARGLKSLVGLWTVWNSRLESGDGVERRARRDSPTRKATEPRDARDRKPSSALSTPPLGSRACASTGHHGDERRDTLARYV